MAKARSRAAARKVKDKWKAKNWYNILAPASFDSVTVSETLSDDSEKLIKRVSEVSLQDITNDFRKSHVKLFFEICNVEGSDAHTQFIGHTLTSDYLRRMIRRKRSKIDGVYDVRTRDGARVRIKPFATTDRRIQTSQKKVIRDIMKSTIVKQARKNTLSAFIKLIIDGKIGSDIYKSCKKIYPVKRVEIYKTQVITQPTIQIEEPKKSESDEKPASEDSTEPTEDLKKEGEEETPIDSEKEPTSSDEEIKKPVEEETDEEPEIDESSDEETEEPKEEEIVEEELDAESEVDESSDEETEEPKEEEIVEEEPDEEPEIDESSEDEVEETKEKTSEEKKQ